MLADLLERSRDQVEDELVRRAAATESTELPIAGRRKRLIAFLQDLIGALRRGAVENPEEPPASPPTNDPALELRERELVRRYLIEQIEQRRIDASPNETVIIAEWVAHGECKRLDEHNRQLRALLDNIPESAVLVAPDGRLTYCNLHAAEHLRTAFGIPKQELIGKTAAELGIPGKLVIGRSAKAIAALARSRERFEMNAWGRESEGQFDAIYRPDGALGAITVVVRDIHSRRLAETRLDLLTKLNAVAGMLDFDEVARAVVEVPLPRVPLTGARSTSSAMDTSDTFIATAIRRRAALRAALRRGLPAWDRHPLWTGPLTNGLSAAERGERRHAAATDVERRGIGCSRTSGSSLIVVPLVSRGRSPAS